MTKILVGLLYLCVHFTYIAGDRDIVTLEFGDALGDRLGPFATEGVSEIGLTGNYKFFGGEETKLFISENGVISFTEEFRDPIPQPLPLSSPPFIAGFWGDIDVLNNDGGIFYKELNHTQQNGRFNRAKSDVLNLLFGGFGRSMEDFDPSHIFVATWDSVHQAGVDAPGIAVTFQIVLTTDGKRTYVLLLYSDVRWDRSNGHGVLVGFNAGNGVDSFTNPLSNGNILSLDRETNSRTEGAFVYRVDGKQIIEPTAAQTSEHVCVNSYDKSREPQIICTCPTDERPRLSINRITCLYDHLIIAFTDDTPLVGEDKVTTHFSANRPGVEMYCHIPKIDRNRKEDCSSGVFERSDLLPGRYSIRIVAKDPHTYERAVLRGRFTILEQNVREEGEACGVTIINTSSSNFRPNKVLEFRPTGATESYWCRLAGQDHRVNCTSPYTFTNLDPGNNKAVIVPDGPMCTSTSSASHFVREE